MQKLALTLGKIKKEYLFLFFLALIIVLLGLSYFKVFKPLLNKVKDANALIAEKETDIARAKISPQELRKLEGEINGLNEQIRYYQQRLTGKADVPQILKELNQIAEGLKIKFISVTPLARKEQLLPRGEESLLQIPIKIKLQCGYHQLGVFINKVENSTKFMKITALKVNAGSNIWEHSVELVVTNYRLIPARQL